MSKQTKTTGLDALMNVSKTIKLTTSTRTSTPSWKEGQALLLELGADKEPVTLEKLTRTRVMADAVKVFGSVEDFNTKDAEKMELFEKLDKKSAKIIGTIKGNAQSNINNNSKEWTVVEIGGGYKLEPKQEAK